MFFEVTDMSRSLQIALISTDYPPLRTSAAVQLRDLAQQFAALGHQPTVIIPSLTSDEPWTVERLEGVNVLRIKAPPTRAATHFRRALAEMWLPFAMLRNLRKSPFRSTKWDLIVWYSPPIFFGPLIWALRRASGARTYLILRDIFPEWAVDLGIIRRGPVYFLFKAVAAFQYAVADTIGVQTESNLAYLRELDEIRSPADRSVAQLARDDAKRRLQHPDCPHPVGRTQDIRLYRQHGRRPRHRNSHGTDREPARIATISGFSSWAAAPNSRNSRRKECHEI